MRVPGLTQETVSDASTLETLLRRGSERRAHGSHCLNSNSSRSHALFQVTPSLHQIKYISTNLTGFQCFHGENYCCAPCTSSARSNRVSGVPKGPPDLVGVENLVALLRSVIPRCKGLCFCKADKPVLNECDCGSMPGGRDNSQ